MIRKGILILLLLTTCQPLFAQEEAIQDIRAKCEAINAKESYKKVQVDANDMSTEGGVFVGYFDGNDLKKITLKLYGEMGNSAEEYFFDDGKLIFVLSHDRHYKYPIGYNEVSEEQQGTVDKTGVQRFYFKNDKLIKWINAKGEEVSHEDAEFPKMGLTVKSEADEARRRIAAGEKK